MKQQHTPGPWEVDEDSSWVNGPNDEIICEVYCDALQRALCIEFDGYEEDDYPLPENYEGEELETARRIADAHLIAAAPDLLEALIGINALFSHLSKDCTQYNAVDKARAAIAKATGE